MTSSTADHTGRRPGTPGRKPDQALAAGDRLARSASVVCDLLARRPELRGVLRTADWLEEATRWSA